MVSVLAASMVASPLQTVPAQETQLSELTLKKNQTIVDVDGRVLGKIHEVDAAGGFVTFTAQMKAYRVPITTISRTGSRLQTTMTRKAIGL